MQQRETKKLNTPSGKEFELKTYLTARERNELRSVYLGGLKVEAENEKPQIKEISGSIVDLAERKIIELAVISYDGNNASILDRLLDGAPEEYDFVVAEANKISTGGFQTAK